MGSTVRQVVRDFGEIDPKVVVLLSFSIGFAFSPLSYGIVYYLIFIIAYEIAWGAYHEKYPMLRVVYVLSGFVGWLVGRFLFKQSIYK